MHGALFYAAKICKQRGVVQLYKNVVTAFVLFIETAFKL